MKPTSATSTEQRRFRLHEHLLFDVIQRQAGTLSKAVLEGVMNAEDAKATSCTVTLTATELQITDDGAGFGSRENITQWFEVFGQPHAESEGKKFGTFRMGRGQLFAYGMNNWATGYWRMAVDIKHKGLDYVLDDVKANAPGCDIKVKLYENIGLSGVSEVTRDLVRWCKWSNMAIMLNGKCLSTDPTEGKWDQITDEAYIRLTETGTLRVYNLGVLVQEYPGSKFGTGGEVVSRKQLKVNFARNDIQSDCPVWRKIKPLVDLAATQRNMNATKGLDDDARQRLADQVVRGDIADKNAVREMRLFTAVTGRHYSAHQIERELQQMTVYSVAVTGDLMGDLFMKRRSAFIFAQATLDRFEVDDGPVLIRLIIKHFTTQDYQRPVLRDAEYIPYEKLTEGLDNSCTLLDMKELRPGEQLWLRILSGSAGQLDREVYGWNGRSLMIGLSQTAAGWTDGRTYVAIERSWLDKRQPDVRGIVEVGRLLIHEACHDTPDIASHAHSQEFYETFHDKCRDVLHFFVHSAMVAVPAAYEWAQKQVPRNVAKQLDKADKTNRVAADVTGTPAPVPVLPPKPEPEPKDHITELPPA